MINQPENTELKFKKSVWNIFIVTSFLVFTWSIVVVLWEIPGLLLKYNMFEIIGYCSYQMAFSFIESLLITLLIILFSFLTPRNYMRVNLSASGSAVIIVLWMSHATFRLLPKMINVLSKITSNAIYSSQIIIGLWLFLTLLSIPLVIKLAKKQFLPKMILKLVDRISVLVCTYIFFSFIGIFIVIMRNIG